MRFNQVVSAVYMADFACSLNCCVMLSSVHLIISLHFMNSDSEAYCIVDIFHGAIFFLRDHNLYFESQFSHANFFVEHS